MEKVKISSVQFFILIVLFEHGSALLIPLAMDAKQDAWLAILLGMFGSLLLYLIYYRLYRYYPNMLPTEYMQKLLGKVLGSALAFLYLLHFSYAAARVLRDFGEMLLTFGYPDSPLFVVNAMLMLLIIYTVHKGLEVVARAGELMFILMYILAVAGFVLIFVSGLIDFSSLKPILGDGIWPVLKTVATQTLYIPYGEAVVFTMIFPYVKDPKKVKLVGLCGIVLSGINLAITMAINVSVLGIGLTNRSVFPLLSTVESIRVADFLERLDVFFMIALVIGGFVKISVFFYAVIVGLSTLFKVKRPSALTYPVGTVILFFSLTIASNFQEHLKEGLTIMPVLLFIPFHVVIPFTLLCIAFIKHRMKKTNALQPS
ncbi:GerAB/ArcD/ProY family transporter [Priestia megaterium]|uniref:GerAB/ArcD/ProY family transporter n=1 Tax=Priestia megaterium TaxID=1404 RepID=UPI000D50EE7E|nr:GerAB/ArcD/ProY family transporter [Priestia megaterium]PVE72643.1 spore gernimation protein KB [Priestia megaterium]PVE89432.1 spore gernimation protein KB [Priestia megaterium]PVE93122.1 spore gernimation protein KB [Priestia megaterium]PVF00401.1 spore gernimation protein KB [Priestia megaterium]RMA91175.1 spore germination protein KB [Priestia megaterium]